MAVGGGEDACQGGGEENGYESRGVHRASVGVETKVRTHTSLYRHKLRLCQVRQGEICERVSTVFIFSYNGRRVSVTLNVAPVKRSGPTLVMMLPLVC